MASTGGGAARSSKKKNPDVAGQEEDTSTDLVVGDKMDRMEQKIYLLVSSITSLVGTVNSSPRRRNQSIRFSEEEEKILRPVFFISRKFSNAAQNWSTIQQEAYGIYYTMHKLQDYLMGKYFEVETDNNNLRWIEASLNPETVRMRIFMQGYRFYV